MKKVLIIVLIMTMLLVSCSSKTLNDPKKVAKEFVEASFRGDVEALSSLIRKSDLDKLKESESKLMMVKEMNLKADVAVDSVKENGKEAVANVSVKLNVEGLDTPQEQTMKISLVVEDGKWVVDTTKSK